ncbi:PREDICTED: uncharacterized protein At4g00950 [Ipomoea nil]|uniref:uncharacterized protein At4g00950 n=1 Tax=Ipomoea nil TaxID=35883 RepID=UPI000900CA0A|nr:PREDICTED: uncharacterized protein At4g00950 [Ipomoea nil]
MAFSDEDYEPKATPKLSLTKFPISKPSRVPLAALTPPLHAPASIPFLWEEAPGKPRTSAVACEASPPQPRNSKTVCRSLDLPPRLLMNNESAAKMTTTPSPTTVLDWPDVSLSSFSSFRSVEEGLVRLRKGESKERSSSSPPSSWESSKENARVCKGSFDFSSSVTDPNSYGKRAKKFARVGRRSSFLNFSRSSSSLLASIYESFKQAVPRRWRQEQMRLSPAFLHFCMTTSYTM